MNKNPENYSDVGEQVSEIVEDQEQIIERPKSKKPIKHHEAKVNLGITHKLHLATHRTLSTTERIIKSLSNAYEHIFVGDESSAASFEKEYGLKYYAKNDFKNALKHFLAYDRAGNQNDADVLFMIAICYVKIDDHAKASEYLQKADEIKPDDYDIVTQLGKSLYEIEDYEDALNYFQKSAEINSEEPDTFYHMANCFEKLEQIEQAKKMYRKAIDINPREAVYYHALGFLYENIGDHKDAIVCFKKAMDLERERGGAVETK